MGTTVIIVVSFLVILGGLGLSGCALSRRRKRQAAASLDPNLESIESGMRAPLAHQPSVVSKPTGYSFDDPSAVSRRRNRHAINVETTTFKPIKDFMRGFVPQKSCSSYILEDCRQAFEEMAPGGGDFLQPLVTHASKITTSKLQNLPAPGGNAAFAFAIVAYTIDLVQFGAQPHQNFFDALNKILHSRDAKLIGLIEGYLHFFVSGIDAIPPMAEREFFRGIPIAHLGTIKERYKTGIRIHWCSVTSVAGSIQVAKDFAAENGIIIHVVARSARSIQAFSTYEDEEEAILAPNFEAIVTQMPDFGADGYWHVHMIEVSEAKTYVY